MRHLLELVSIIAFSILLLCSCKKEKAEPPIAEFTAVSTSGDMEEPIFFLDKSTNEPTSWLWKFGDGGSSNDQDPTHGYTLPGIYHVSLLVSNQAGSDNIVKLSYITIGSVPASDFSVSTTSAVVGEEIIFTDNSLNNPLSWLWDFGDGSQSSEQNPNHTYSEIGTYTVSLTSTNGVGSDKETKTDLITVRTTPVADFYADNLNVNPGSEISFTDNSNYNPTEWLWVFGDGNQSTDQNPKHTYTKIGIYSVTLTVANEIGENSKTATGYITVTYDGLSGTLTDYDDNIYNWVGINNQVWMAENLKVTHYPNGDPIPYEENGDNWAALGHNNTDDAYCYYLNDVNSPYGVLYNYASAIGDDWERDNSENQGVCPDGWHLPSEAEWSELENSVKDDGYSLLEGKALKSTSGWNYNGNGTDDYNFTGLPGGFRLGSGKFALLLSQGYWSSSTASNDSNYIMFGMFYGSTYVTFSGGYKSTGISVRCVRDE